MHDDDIEPFAEFPANFALGTDDFEAERTVEADGGVVAAHDSGHHSVKAPGRGNVENLGDKGSGDTLASEVGMDIDRIFNSGGIGRAASVGRG